MTPLTCLRELVRILDDIGGYLTHDDQQWLFLAKEMVIEPKPDPKNEPFDLGSY